MQSRGGQVRGPTSKPQSADGVTYAVSHARFARRRLLKAAVFGPQGDRAGVALADHAGSSISLNSGPSLSVTGYILDVSPQVLVLQTTAGEERFMLAASTTAWRGAPVPPVMLRQGDRVIVRRNYVNTAVADRIWAKIGRVTGTITARDGSTLFVDDGMGGEPRILVIAPCAAGKIQVRFPRLLPGYLIDVIGLTHRGFLEGLVPATAQPPRRADQPQGPPLVSGHVPDSISGTATWHEPGDEPGDLMGVAYPALDPETACEVQAGASRGSPDTGAADGYPRTAESRARVTGPLAVDPHLAGPGCVRLPYLSVGSVLQVRNDCAKRARLLPVTSCGATARLFCDRCIACGTSPRGRVADLTMAAFADLGGDLEAGCFNATITIGG